MNLKYLLNALRWPLSLAIGGGSGGSGSNVTEWKPMDELKDYHPQVVEQAAALSAKPYEAYPFNRVADMNKTQLQGLQSVSDLAVSSSPDVNAGRNVTLNTLTGSYQNPYATMQTSVGQNDFMGINNPYLRGMIQSGQKDIGDAYRYATSPNSNAMAALSKNYGGSAHLAQQEMNQDQLLKAMQGVESNYGNMAYQQSAGLAESALNRGVQAQQTDFARATAAWDAERNRQMAAIPQALANQQAEMGNYKTLVGVGDALQQQQQAVYNDKAAEWQRSQSYPQAQLDAFLNTLVRASGGFGTNSQVTSDPYTINPASALLGGGLLAYGATKG